MIEIKLNEKLCKSCGICVAFCPKKVLEIQPGKLVEIARPEDCVGCKLCQYRCPDFALEVIK